jgi:hypothetical protein
MVGTGNELGAVGEFHEESFGAGFGAMLCEFQKG